MGHVLTFIDTDPRNFKAVEKWINSLDYGSRPFCRELRLFDIAIQEEHLPKFLADLKYYEKEGLIGLGVEKTNFIKKVIQWALKFLKLQPINMEEIKKTPQKWFKPIEFPKGVTHGVYMFPVGLYPDRLDRGNNFKNREI